MKKTLIIVRHAHTHDPEPGQPDHERILTSEGRIQAHKSAVWLKEQGSIPQKIVASSACRTQATASIFAEVLFNDADKFEAESHLFRASETEVLEYIQEHFGQEDSVMIVGHNPTATQLAIRLGATSVSYLPPASIVILSFDIQKWEDIRFHSGKLVEKLLTDEA